MVPERVEPPTDDVVTSVFDPAVGDALAAPQARGYGMCDLGRSQAEDDASWSGVDVAVEPDITE